jgi:hypothetical protein
MTQMYCVLLVIYCENQCFGSGLDPDSIRSVDPDSESGSRRAKITHKNRIMLRKFHVLKCWMFSFDGRRLLL